LCRSLPFVMATEEAETDDDATVISLPKLPFESHPCLGVFYQLAITHGREELIVADSADVETMADAVAGK